MGRSRSTGFIGSLRLGVYTPGVEKKAIAWGLPAALGAAGYGVFVAAGLPEWMVFPMILLGAVLGSALIAAWRPRRGEPPGNKQDL